MLKIAYDVRTPNAQPTFNIILFVALTRFAFFFDVLGNKVPLFPPHLIVRPLPNLCMADGCGDRQKG